MILAGRVAFAHGRATSKAFRRFSFGFDDAGRKKHFFICFLLMTREGESPSAERAIEVDHRSSQSSADCVRNRIDQASRCPVIASIILRFAAIIPNSRACVRSFEYGQEGDGGGGSSFELDVGKCFRERL
jgi:hypothetical protein